MATDRFVKHYDQLRPAERCNLALEAMARDDDIELSRIRNACPQCTTRGSDPRYAARMAATFHVAAAGCLDFQMLVGKLHILRLASDIMPGSPAQLFDGIAAGVAVELVSLWEGFGRFCRSDIELDPMALLKAWRYPTDGLAKTLELYADIKPDEQRAAEYAAILSQGWADRSHAWSGEHRSFEAL